MSDVGDAFQRQTKYRPETMGDEGLHWNVRPELYKTYPDSPKVVLPAFEPNPPMSLDKTLNDRKSIRNFRPEPLTLGQLSYLLWASTGIQRLEQAHEFRTAPSAGAVTISVCQPESWKMLKGPWLSLSGAAGKTPQSKPSKLWNGTYGPFTGGSIFCGDMNASLILAVGPCRAESSRGILSGVAGGIQPPGPRNQRGLPTLTLAPSDIVVSGWATTKSPSARPETISSSRSDLKPTVTGVLTSLPPATLKT